jgi:hypothetical protein
MTKEFSLKNLFYFYRYLLHKKTNDFLIFFLITFVLALFPYFVVWFSIINLSSEKQQAFYGDGSIIIFCSALLCNYFSMLFEYRSDGEKKRNIVINLVLVLLYVTTVLYFRECQLNFDRSWSFICQTSIISGILLLLTLLIAMYLNFNIHINYKDVQDHIEELKLKKIERQVQKKKKSKGGIEV